MRLVFDAFVATFEMLGIFFSAFVVVFLLALFLSPIENVLSKWVWKHSHAEIQKNVPKSNFKQFSQKHR